MFIDSILDYTSAHTPNWHIANTCPNLIMEIEGAVYDRDIAGALKETIDGACPDHAITSAVYGLHGNYAITDPKANEVDLEKAAQEQAKRRSEESYEEFGSYRDTVNHGGRGGVRLGGSREGAVRPFGTG